MSDHPNVGLDCCYSISDDAIRQSIEDDGTLILRVSCEFVVHHASRAPVTDETLAELIMSQGVCETNIDKVHIMEVNSE